MACSAAKTASASPNWTLPPDGHGELWDSSTLAGKSKAGCGGDCGCSGGGDCSCGGKCEGGCGGGCGDGVGGSTLGWRDQEAVASEVWDRAIARAGVLGSFLSNPGRVVFEGLDQVWGDAPSQVREATDDATSEGVHLRAEGPTSGSLWCCDVPGRGRLCGYRHPTRYEVCMDPGHEECYPCQVAPPPPPPPPVKHPCPCMDDYMVLRLCLWLLQFSHDPGNYNEALGECERLERTYRTCAQGHPECPVVALPFRKKVCGPDVTKFIVKSLMDMVMRKDPFTRGIMVTPLIGSLDLKTRPGKPGPAVATGCMVACPASVTICGHCLNDQVPGNIGLGAANINARTIGAVAAAAEGGTDSEEDIAAYEVGEDVHEAARGMRGMNAGHGRISLYWKENEFVVAKRLEDALCAAIANQVGAGKMHDQGCPPCSRRWP